MNTIERIRDPAARTYDLHCHSNQSDGSLSPEELVSRAKVKEVSVLALTDHDTVIGLSRAKAQAKIENIELISGIEFSTQWQGRNIHIVGLNIDLNNVNLLELIEKQEGRRHDRAKMIGQKLEAVGVEGAYEGAQRFSGPGVVGRPHFAKYLIEQGYVSSMEKAFKRYLGAGKPGDVKLLWPSFEEVIPVIVGSAGVAVIAHPTKYEMTRTKLCHMVEDFVESGGRGIEVVSGNQDARSSLDMAKIGVKYGLLGSVGSDFHTPSNGWAELGRCASIPAIIDPVWSAWER